MKKIVVYALLFFFLFLLSGFGLGYFPSGSIMEVVCAGVLICAVAILFFFIIPYAMSPDITENDNNENDEIDC